MIFSQRKGMVLFFGIFFGALVALAFFWAVGSKTITLDAAPKGQWHFDFIKNAYLPAEKDLLERDINIHNGAIKAIWRSAQNGGFAEKSACGGMKTFSMWNTKDQWCAPLANNTIGAFSEKIINEKYKYSDVKWAKGTLVGSGKKVTINAPSAYYTYSTDFAVDVPYDITEYVALVVEAKRLVSLCGNSTLLESCLTNATLNSWKFSSCTEEKYDSQDGKVPFCVLGQELFFPSSLQIAKKRPVEYRFALDFS